MSFEQTEKNRTLSQSKNINLGEFISPKGSTGQATPDYVGDSLWNDFGDAMGRLGRGIKDYGDVIGKQRKEEEQKQQTAYESDMYDKIRNIQRMPESVMTSSQKEIEVDKVVKEYSKIVPFEKRVQILNANNANVNETYTYLASKAGKEQAVSQQVKQNEDLAKVALEYDPSMLDKPFATQVERGREIADTQNLMHSYLSQAIVIGNSKDPQSVSARENCFDQMAVYADQLLPLEMKKAYWEGRLTENDIVSFRNSLALSLSTSENPFTGTQLGKEQAEYFSKNISDRLFKNMTDARADAMKHTSEYQKNYIDVVTNTYLLKTDPAALVMLGKSPEAFANYFSMNREQLTEELRNIGTTSDGNHLVFPGDTSNEIITALANNKKMPQQCSDARLELEARQGRQQPSPSTNKNFLEQLKSYEPGYYNTLEPSDKKRHVDGLKQSMPTRMSLDIKSLVQAKIKPQEGEGWFGTIIRNINNAVVGEGVSYDEGSLLTQGNKSDLINSAVNEYADTLRNAGVDESDIKDIVVEAYRLSGVPVKETEVAPGNYAQLATKALSAIDPANIVTEFGQAMTNVATGVASSMSQEEQQEDNGIVNTEQAITSITEEPKTLQTDDGTVNISSIYDTKEYKDLKNNLVTAVKNKQMTEDQARNEMSVFLNKIGNAFSSVGKELLGVKTAEAATTNTTAIKEAERISKLSTTPVDKGLYDTIVQSELSDSFRSNKNYVDGNDYVVYSDKKTGGNLTVGPGVLLDDTGRQLLRNAGYNGSFNKGDKIPQYIVNAVSVQLFNHKANDAVRICNNNGIDLNRHPELKNICIDAHYNGALPALLQSLRNYIKNPSRTTATGIMSAVKSKAKTIWNNKERRDWWNKTTSQLPV